MHSDGEHAPHLVESFVGEGRIILRVRTTPDGRQVPIALHDAQLGRDCVPTVTEDGKLRCTVRVARNCQYVPATMGVGDVLTPIEPFWKDEEARCLGGPIWIARRPADPGTRFGLGAHGPEPEVAGRAMRFADVPRSAPHPALWPSSRVQVLYDKTEDLGPEVFAELTTMEDETK